MSDAPLKVAVVGHTNTGKTSLLRTLTRDARFGEVSDQPGTTRHVEGTALLVEGNAVAELYDTPGLEDSIALLDALDQFRGDRRATGYDLVQRFLAAELARERFAQEAKALRQVLGCDVALYVVDARERVLGKYRDELTILSHCGRPVVPVLNFVAATDARTSEWREQLARLNLHAVAKFDTVAVDELSEQRLFEKMRTLLDAHRPTLDALIADRKRLRDELIHGSAAIVAELLIDAAAHVLRVPASDKAGIDAAMAQLKARVRQREQQAVRQLLDLFRFGPDDYLPAELPLADGKWDMDLFNPETMRRFGVRTGGGAAAGAAAGLAIDAVAGGLTLGLGTVLGTATGAVLGSGSAEGRRLVDRLRGYRELRCNDATLLTLERRQIALIRALLRRGHANVSPVQPDTAAGGALAAVRGPRVPESLDRARAQPAWSSLNGGWSLPGPGGQRRRAAAREQLVQRIEPNLRRAGAGG